VAQLGGADNLTGKSSQAVAQMFETNGSPNLQQFAAKIPWSHNILLMEKVKGLPVRLWYMQQTIEHGWSRDTLTAMIKGKVHRQGQAISNFSTRFPAPQSELARQLLKDPYKMSTTFEVI
jgi:predicted nuclease of restriction endonuclease-like (RecB) superfamily